MSIALWGQIAQSRNRVSTAFLALSGALLAGLGQLVEADFSACDCLSTLAVAAAVSAMVGVGAGATHLVWGYYGSLQQARAEWEHGQLEGKSRATLRDIDSKFEPDLAKHSRTMLVILGVQVYAWTAGAIFYGSLLVVLLR